MPPLLLSLKCHGALTESHVRSIIIGNITSAKITHLATSTETLKATTLKAILASSLTSLSPLSLAPTHLDGATVEEATS
jgi:hypothetical protein